MKKLYFLRTAFIFTLLATLGFSAHAQTTATATFANIFPSIAAGANLPSPAGTIDDNLKFTTEKNGSTTAPTYYATGATLRMYVLTSAVAGDKSGTLTIQALNGVTISSVKLFALANYTPPVKYSADGGAEADATLNSTDNTYTIDGLSATSSFAFRNAISGANTQLRITKMEITYTGGVAVGSTTLPPVFTPAAGTYYDPTSISIASPDGGSIYYTTDGTEPTTSSAAYTAPFTISDTTTVKAIAVAAGKATSLVNTAVYNIPQITATVATIAELRALPRGSSRLYRFTGNAVITLKSASRNAKYVQDATGAILIDDNRALLPNANYNVGDALTGLVGYTSVNTGMLQFVQQSNKTASVSATGSSVTPAKITIDQLGTAYEAQLVEIEGLTISDVANGNDTLKVSTNYTVTDAAGATGVLRLQYNDLSNIGRVIPKVPQTITGVVLTYTSGGTTTYQFVPISITETLSIGEAADNSGISISASQGSIVVNAETAIKDIQVFNASGQLLKSVPATVGTNVLPVAASQFYIVKAGLKVAKVFVK